MNLYDFTTIGISMIAFAFSIFALLKINKNRYITAAKNDENETKITDLKNVISNLQIGNSNEFEKIVLKIQKLNETINVSKSETNDFLRKQIAALSIDELRITISKVEARITEFAKASKSSLDYILDLRKFIDNDIKKLYDSLNREKEIAVKNLALINEQTNSKFNNIEHRFETKFNEIVSNTKVLQTDTKVIFKSIGKVDKLFLNFSDKISSLTNQFESEKGLLTETVSEINRKFIDYDSKVSSLENQFVSEKGLLTDAVSEINRKFIDYDTKVSSLENQFVSEKGLLTDAVSEINRKFIDYDSKVSSLENQFVSEKGLFTDAVSEINRKFIDYDSKVSSLENQFVSEKGLLTDAVSEINRKFIDYDSKVSSVEDQFESEKESHRSMLSSLKTDVYAQIHNFAGTIENIDSKITKSLESQNLGYKESINILNTELDNYNKEIFNQLNTIEAIYNEFYRNYESFSISIVETVKSIGDKQNVLKLNIKKLGDQFIADTKDIEIKIDSTSKNFITRIKQYTDKNTENYNRIEEAFIIEKLRISKALKLGRTSLSGLQLLFQNKRKVDQLADKNTIKDLQPYVNDVARLGFLNQLAYQRFNRNLDSKVSEEIISSFKKHLNMELSPNKLFYMAHKVWMIEGCCVGRLATNVEDAIIRCLFAYKTVSNNQELRGLEIGTLFGINLCCLAELVSNHTKHFHFTIIDPLEGYYSLSPNDIVVDEPVNESVFFRNVTRYTQRKNVSLIKKFTTQLTKKTLPQKTYNYVLIDGDHTYEGVKLDFELFKNSIEPGGFVIFDDYGTKDWPDVKKYVDKEVHKLDDFEKVLSISRTCVYQKR